MFWLYSQPLTRGLLLCFDLGFGCYSPQSFWLAWSTCGATLEIHEILLRPFIVGPWRIKILPLGAIFDCRPTTNHVERFL
jgi:hypothetical protein